MLKDHIYLEELDGVGHNWESGYTSSLIGKRWSLQVTVGMYDDPEEQAQRPLTLEFPSCGHIALCGTVVSGKSTFIQTMIYGLLTKYSPDELELYLLDFKEFVECFHRREMIDVDTQNLVTHLAKHRVVKLEEIELHPLP